MRTTIAAQAFAGTRIATGVAALVTTLESHITLSLIATGRITVPFFEWLPPINDQTVSTFFALGVLSSIALIAGFQSRIAAGMVAALTAFVLLWDQQTYSNHLVLLLCLCAYLAMGQPGEVFSLDARIRGHRDKSVPYWPTLLIMTQVSIVYFFTALAKVNAVFLSGDVIRSVMWVQLPEYAYVPLSIGAVGLEFFLAFALWSRRLIKVAIAFGLVLHASIVVTLDQPIVLFAFAALTVGTYPLFYARAGALQDSSDKSYSESRRARVASARARKRAASG